MDKHTRKLTIDGNEAAARMAFATNEVIAIYPITPASPMGEYADAWASNGQVNLWGAVPRVVEMQSEGGAAGAIHGALQTGALTTTFTASQGLLLMLPNMYKIAGELTPTVLHVAARSLAAQALSIFCDHSDVMAARATGFGLLASNSVQEVMDLALVAQAASLRSRIPLVHFFDGFRTSHEIAGIENIAPDIVAAMLDEEAIHQHRQRALSPEHPVLRGSSQNPDVYFQGRESVNPYYAALPGIMQECMDKFAELTGRAYQLYEYHGDEKAERVIILMGSGAETAAETVDHLCAHGESVGVLKVRLYRPLEPLSLLHALPVGCKKIAVLDRTKEPGALGEPLYLDVATALLEDAQQEQPYFSQTPQLVGGRYGLSSKEFTPGMVKAVFDELKENKTRNHFTIGIYDDVSNTSLTWDKSFRTDAGKQHVGALFYGLGSDGTVSANKNTIKILGEHTDHYCQGYFVYDSKKSGAITVSHLRFGPHPIQSSYLLDEGDASFVGCHQEVFLERYDMLSKARQGAAFLLNTPYEGEALWQQIPESVQQQLIDKEIEFYTIDAYAIAEKYGLGRRINTIMQTCFFAISDLLPQVQAIATIKDAVQKTYGKRGKTVVESNHRAIDASLQALNKIPLPSSPGSTTRRLGIKMAEDAPKFVHDFTSLLLAGQGDEVPVSMMPADGSFPTATTQWEKRNLALEIPEWDENLCIQCGKCPFVCPHSAIRSKVFDPNDLEQAPKTFKHAVLRGKDFPENWHISYQVAPEDCTGCTLCVDICPVKDKKNPGRRALNMVPQAPLRAQEAENWDFFLKLPEYDRSRIRPSVMKEAMLLQPLFEFSGACSGCGETPYLRLASQLFGERMQVANATGCSSIYGGNLPTTPWAQNEQGRGPAWNNSLFEDNAEFGLGMRLAVDQKTRQANELLNQLKDDLDADFITAIQQAEQASEADLYEQRQRVEALQAQLAKIDKPEARALQELAEAFIRRSIWIVGGDGWAYDIGFGGLDHVLASGQDVNILVLDTEVYSNTGGQTSKSTPRGAVAKFSAGGKPTAKKDLAMIAMSYENVYVAQVAYAGKDVQTLRAFMEAESYPGTSIIIAYAPCIAWGNDMANNHHMQDMAVRSGHWPLLRYDPRRLAEGLNPLQLDSKPPSISYRDFVGSETRFNMLWRSHAEEAEQLLEASQQEAKNRYLHYKELSELDVHGDSTADKED